MTKPTIEQRILAERVYIAMQRSSGGVSREA